MTGKSKYDVSQILDGDKICDAEQWQTATEFIQIFQDPQLRKSNFCMSLFDIPKYAQMKKVLVCQNMLRSDHMDKYGIGTDCSVDTLNMFLSSSNLPSWP